ncbi:hypothetical protein [Asticcacaulis sp.]|uniref:hypothetical protein n=1 Tax=Asticcacaulis sp. TaxID=1872648 RepID=UPI002624DBA8|nr:hypothetical protein [Asticcacaulis sp.]
MTYRDITIDEHCALEAFAAAHGRNWRNTLVLDYWCRPQAWEGHAETMGATLHALRNSHGNEWLYQHYRPRAGSPAEQNPTPTQLDVLERIRDGGITKVKHSDTSYRIAGFNNASVVGRVVSLRWARWPQGPFRAQTCELTDAGIRLLAQHRPTPALAPACAAE